MKIYITKDGSGKIDEAFTKDDLEATAEANPSVWNGRTVFRFVSDDKNVIVTVKNGKAKILTVEEEEG